jgi:lipopolysaccharide/colanic/teichoic acid biosynthesis glycosyltransferase
MNNSKISAAATSQDVAIEPQTFDYRPTWDNLNKDLLPSSSKLHNGCGDDISGTKYLGKHPVQNSLGHQTIAIRPRLEPRRLDLGLWLLWGSTKRQGRWEHLPDRPGHAAKIQMSILKWSPAIKRSCDVAGSMFLLTILSPLFILIAALIKLDSAGPVFFRHYRVGEGGKQFLLWKFRSMKLNVPKYAVSPISATDCRLTRIGRLLRRFSIDEIPQLINVLKGEMSLVGPRPEMPFVVESYRPADYRRFAVRPGITGLWQISPARAFPIHENLQYDFHYIHNQNVILDCAIIVRTITAVIRGIGAV